MKGDITAPDKNPEYFKQLSEMASAFDTSGDYSIEVKGFFDDDKISIWEKAGKPDMRDIISCYAGNNCGTCLACMRRLLSLDYIYDGEYDIDAGDFITKLEDEDWIIDSRIKEKHEQANR